MEQCNSSGGASQVGNPDAPFAPRGLIDEHGIRWIIDYKTGSHLGGDPTAFIDNEQQRYQGQLERYAALMGGLEQRPIRLGLYFPLLTGWREWEPD